MGVVRPDERVTSRPELLRLITINYARLTGEDAIKGSIEPGKLADFAILSEDFLTVAPGKIDDMRALATYVGGREVYRAPDSMPISTAATCASIRRDRCSAPLNGARRC